MGDIRDVIEGLEAKIDKLKQANKRLQAKNKRLRGLCAEAATTIGLVGWVPSSKIDPVVEKLTKAAGRQP